MNQHREIDTEDTLFAVKKHPAQFVFALFLVLLCALLLYHAPTQAKFFDGIRLFAQPGTWPLLALALIAIFGLPYLWTTYRDLKSGAFAQISTELIHWLKALEYPVWFLVYVWIVPYLGYLPTTLLFCPILTWRLGYRSLKPLMLSMLAACIIVIIFKSFLQVKIPGGVVYEMLPAALRNFMILRL